MRQLNEDIIKEIIRLRKEGYKIKYIVNKLKVNKNTVVKYTKKALENE